MKLTENVEPPSRRVGKYDLVEKQIQRRIKEVQKTGANSQWDQLECDTPREGDHARNWLMRRNRRMNGCMKIDASKAGNIVKFRIVIPDEKRGEYEALHRQARP